MDYCPKCNIQIDRKLGLPGIVLTCGKCGQDFVKFLDKLILKSDFLKEADNWHGV
jgi:hypothetical protein